jgi:hypothetical protein
MTQRLGLLFRDGSVLVLADRMDLSTAWQEAAEYDGEDAEPETAVVLLEFEIKTRFEPEVRSRHRLK